MGRKPIHYLENQELEEELRKYRESSEDPEQRRPSERLGELLILMHTNILRH